MSSTAKISKKSTVRIKVPNQRRDLGMEQKAAGI